MAERFKGALPLALVVAVLAFLWVEFSLNFTFHWVTDGDLGNGLALPKSFHLVTAAAFVTWGCFFAAGADMSAFVKNALGAVVGSIAALALFGLSAKTADLPDFWGIALWVMILAFVLVMASALGDFIYVPGIFASFAVNVLWWTATGLDFWAPKGGGVGNSVKALADPASAGAGAFGGVISTPWGWVGVNCMVSLLLGCALGLLSVKIVGLVTSAATAEEGREEVVDAPHARPAH